LGFGFFVVFEVAMPLHQELPEQFGRYRILKKLGAGGMGTVYLAEDVKLRRKVALKVPHFRASIRAAGLERFQREARLAASIEHPNFCPVYDVDEVDGIHFFTMAYLEGTSLADLLAGEQPWPPAQAVDMVRRVALAVGQLHRRGIVHRDLKPANLMVRSSGEPVLMDFGLACSLVSESDRLTSTGEVLGTLAYMPPEQLEGDRQQLGPTADVYSLGMILYELLTGQLPFTGRLFALGQQIRSKVPEPPSTWQPGLDARLDVICLKALAKKPEERFPDTNAFVAALEEFLPTPGEVGRAPSTIMQPRSLTLPSHQETTSPKGLETATSLPRQPAGARHRGPLMVLLLAVLVTGVWLGVHFWPSPDKGTPDQQLPDKGVDQKKEETLVPRTPPSITLGKEELRKFTGKYESKVPRVEVSIELVGDQLQTAPAGLPTMPLIPLTPTRFKLSGFPIETFLEFELADGKVKSLTMEQNRKKITLLPKK
jgi:serine/threonine protein kinase